MNSTLFESDGPHDDTKVDLVKVMNRFQTDKELEEEYQRQLSEKMNDFDDLRQLLRDTNLISEAILESGRPFNPNKDSLYLPTAKVAFATVEWKDIEHTSLGRRLTSYFDQLKAERRLLAA